MKKLKNTESDQLWRNLEMTGGEKDGRVVGGSLFFTTTINWPNKKRPAAAELWAHQNKINLTPRWTVDWTQWGQGPIVVNATLHGHETASGLDCPSRDQRTLWAGHEVGTLVHAGEAVQHNTLAPSTCPPKRRALERVEYSQIGTARQLIRVEEGN